MHIKITLLLLMLFSIQNALSDNLYVRPDGGTWQQCNGSANVPYSVSISNKACAVKHLFELLDPQSGDVRMNGGDTVNIMNNSDGSAAEYPMGSHGDYTSGNCHSAWGYSCVAPSIPSGTAANPTRIIGGGSNTCSIKPVLWGTGRAKHILNIDSSEYIKVSCLTITDKSSCIGASGFPDESKICDRSAPYNKPFADTGIFIRDSKEITLSHLDIEGLSKGIHAGRLMNIYLTNVNIHANYGAGWDGDIGFMGGNGSANSGTISFKDSSITFNGCGLIYNPGSIDHKEPHSCAKQDIGGYGDGLGTAETGGDWIFDNVKVLHNNSDGIDLLYHSLGGKVTITNSHFEGNAGNQLKVAGNSELTNNIILGTCAWNSRQKPSLGEHAENCRALGNPLSLSYTHSDTKISLINNTVYSEGDCILGSGNRTGVARSNQSLYIINNVFYALKDWRQNENACMYYTESPFPITQIHNNLIHKPKGFGDPCNEFRSNTPEGGIDSICTTSVGPYYDDSDHSIPSNPQLTEIRSGHQYTSYDLETLTAESNKPIPLSTSSPVVDNGYNGTIIGVEIPSTDYFGDPRSGNPDIGAIEFKVLPKPPTILDIIKVE